MVIQTDCVCITNSKAGKQVDFLERFCIANAAAEVIDRKEPSH